MENSGPLMNISSRLTMFAKTTPDKRAVVFPQYNIKKNRYLYSSLTYKELDILSNKFALMLKKMGLNKGDRAVIILSPGLDFFAMTFAMFKLGVVPVFLDRSMGITKLLSCIMQSQAQGLIANGDFFILKYFYPKVFKTIKVNVTAGRLSWANIISINKMKRGKVQSFTPCELQAIDPAAIVFTEDEHHIPHGVLYTHDIINQRASILKDSFNLSNNDVGLTTTPMFSLLSLSLGLTCCFSDTDLGKSNKVSAQKLVRSIQDLAPSFMAASPAIFEQLSDFCIEFEISLPGVKSALLIGAPVAPKLHRKLKSLFPNGTSHTLYGSKAAFPVSSISGDFVLKKTAHLTEDGHGNCIGIPVNSAEIKIIKITDKVISSFAPEIELPANEVGEIIIKGPMVSQEYFNHKLDAHEVKISHADSFWLRMGDIGYIDREGLLWFCGRKSHVVTTKTLKLYPVACEAIFNKHPAVKRSALVGLGEPGNQTPVIVIERVDGQHLMGKGRSIFESELFSIAKKYPHTRDIQKIYLSKHLPVDREHNIKIDRLKLKEELESAEFI